MAEEQRQQLHSAITAVIDYRQHLTSCEINQTDFCSCGLREAMDALDTQWKHAARQLAEVTRERDAAFSMRDTVDAINAKLGQRTEQAERERDNAKAELAAALSVEDRNRIQLAALRAALEQLEQRTSAYFNRSYVRGSPEQLRAADAVRSVADSARALLTAPPQEP